MKPPSPHPKSSSAGIGRVQLVLAVLLVALALQASLLWIAHRPEQRRFFGDEEMYWEGASRLAAGETWSAEALWPPLQFQVLGRILALSGGSRLAVELTQLLMLLGVALLVLSLTRELTGSELAAGVAASLVLLYPPMAAAAHYLWPEVLHLLLALGALWILVKRGDRPLWLATAGVALGLALLAKSLLAPFLPILLLPLALRGSALQRVGRPAIVVGATLVTLVAAAPSVAAGSGFVGRAAFNLWVGINDRSPTSLVDPVAHREYRAYLASAATPSERNRILWRKIGRRVEALGVDGLLREQLGRQYFRLFDRESFFTVQLPGGIVHRQGRGYIRPPAALATLLRGLSFGLYGLILLGAAVGVAVVPARGRRWLQVGLAFVAYNLAIFLLLHVKSRYRLQFLPILMMYCGCAVAWARARFGRGEAVEGWRQRLPGWVWPLAALLLLLAFGGGWIYS